MTSEAPEVLSMMHAITNRTQNSHVPKSQDLIVLPYSSRTQVQHPAMIHIALKSVSSYQSYIR